MSKTAIIVLNWNGAADTIRCIKSLEAQSVLPTIILIDNASDDNSIDQLNEFLSSYKNSVVFIKNTVNNGYSGGINIGLRHALSHNFDYIGVLNPDAIAEKTWLENLLSEFNENSGAVTGLLLNKDGKLIDSTGEQYSIWGLPSPRHRNQSKDKAPKKPSYIFGASGGATVYSATMLRQVGLLDEKFFMYFEDVDLSFRYQLSGYTTRFTPKAIAYHDTGSSSRKVSGLTVYMTFKNVPLLLWKNVPAKLFPKVVPRFFLTYSLLLVNALIKGSGWPALKGVAMSIIYMPHTLLERRKIQKIKVVSYHYISSIMLHNIPRDQIKLRQFRKIFTGKN